LNRKSENKSGNWSLGHWKVKAKERRRSDVAEEEEEEANEPTNDDQLTE
jgi:hypothetical protein